MSKSTTASMTDDPVLKIKNKSTSSGNSEKGKQPVKGESDKSSKLEILIKRIQKYQHTKVPFTKEVADKFKKIQRHGKRKAETKQFKAAKDVIKFRALEESKRVNRKQFTCKDWKEIVDNNGATTIKESSLFKTFKGKGKHQRPLTVEMYDTLVDALINPDTFLVLKETVRKVQIKDQKCQALGLPTPANVALPENKEPVSCESARVTHRAINEVVEPWFEVHGSKINQNYIKVF